MDKNKGMKFSLGTTLLSFTILFIIFQWNKHIEDVLIYELLINSLISFIIGFGFSLIIKIAGFKTDYNITSLFIIVFFFSMYLLLGNIKIGKVSSMDFTALILIAGFVSVAIGFLKIKMF